MSITVEDKQVQVLITGQKANVSITPQVATIVAASNIINVFVQPRTADIITVGTQGPPGIPEDEVPYADRSDLVYDVDGNVTGKYFAQAAPGSASSDPVWRISYTSYNAEYDGTKQWADGDSLFNNVWDDHLSLSYA